MKQQNTRQWKWLKLTPKGRKPWDDGHSEMKALKGL
jgi:hypothetical protein